MHQHTIAPQTRPGIARALYDTLQSDEHFSRHGASPRTRRDHAPTNPNRRVRTTPRMGHTAAARLLAACQSVAIPVGQAITPISSTARARRRSGKQRDEQHPSKPRLQNITPHATRASCHLAQASTFALPDESNLRQTEWPNLSERSSPGELRFVPWTSRALRSASSDVQCPGSSWKTILSGHSQNATTAAETLELHQDGTRNGPESAASLSSRLARLLFNSIARAPPRAALQSSPAYPSSCHIADPPCSSSQSHVSRGRASPRADKQLAGIVASPPQSRCTEKTIVDRCRCCSGVAVQSYARCGRFGSPQTTEATRAR
jgi:hypothetical protein